MTMRPLPAPAANDPTPVAQLAALLQVAGGSLWLVDSDLRLVAANETFQQLVQYQLGRPLAVGEPLLAPDVPPEAGARWASWYARALAGETFEVEYEPSHPWVGKVVTCHLAPIRSAEGAVCGVAVHCQDLTAWRLDQAALARSEERLRLALDAVSQGIWDWEIATGTVFANTSWWASFGYQRAEVAATAEVWLAALHPDDAAETLRKLDDYLAGRSPAYHSEHRIVTRQGTVRYHLSAGKVVAWDDAGQPLRMVGTNTDITERKLAELALQQLNAELESTVAARTAELEQTVVALGQANAGKQAFLAAASHELRTPLTGILGMAELLEQKPGDGPQQRHYVALLQESGQRLLNTVNLVILYAHLTSRAWQLQTQPVAWAALVDAVLRAAPPDAQRKGQQIHRHVVFGPADFCSDAEAIRRLLELLLDNAVKFTPPGGQIVITVEPTRDGAAARLTVADTGIGMDAATVAQIYAPFVQGDGRLARRFEGLGLGLACVQELVTLLGGTLAVDSTPGVGSSFTVILPTLD